CIAAAVENRRKSPCRCGDVSWSDPCSTRGMPSPIRRSLVIAATILVAATAAHAQPPAPPSSSRIRPESKEARALLDELLARSPTARRLADRIEAAGVIVYVRYRWFATDTIDGHIGL